MYRPVQKAHTPSGGRVGARNDTPAHRDACGRRTSHRPCIIYVSTPHERTRRGGWLLELSARICWQTGVRRRRGRYGRPSSKVWEAYDACTPGARSSHTGQPDLRAGVLPSSPSANAKFRLVLHSS
eukprot:scaffold926_cov408-Prasinococcus_capsulatus_cf.AAC.7